MRGSEILALTAETIGFLSATALSWQAFRFVRHLRTVKDLRDAASDPVSSKMGEMALAAARLFKQTVERWDRKDHWLITVGLIGVPLSFLIKVVSIIWAGHEH